MFVSRPLLNHGEFLAWAKSEGFADTVAADKLHVTIATSRGTVNWEQILPCATDLTVRTGGRRSVRNFGGVIVLIFGCQRLSHRHAEFRRLGMSWDFSNYSPHISFAFDEGVDLAKVQPFFGRLHFGLECFQVDQMYSPGVYPSMG
ncbi:phage prohead protein [Rhizobium rhizogenes]|uniref:phage prohead protein n=1 Tax=Rhizobium rhizogenes TaxID=359 RepID=UPI0015743155|nr:phage prohead protein [Rhizobium rhizogenes]NTG64733.1 phage prohead protein [Rhizobium rhizogenes]NTH68458.1 phage prohead protein [Rhizobium rhizogenes]NTH99935.1 phage prohead protein [Rhizobium rhizogenes]NTI39087.1 phage prohead protein [Rhizobium rhizogenes]NTJ18227.1 phage prohead protein [Rhizobium rhizogenes]